MSRSCALALKRNYEPVMIICAHLLNADAAVRAVQAIVSSGTDKK
ncbi:hypothetical protein [Nostoc sp.]